MSPKLPATSNGRDRYAASVAEIRDGTKRSRSALSRALVTSELLDKATEIFAQKGYEATTLADVAQALGISRPALYHYVRNKEDLLTMLVEQVSQGLAVILEQLAARRDMSAEEKLTDVVCLMVRQRAERPDHFRILDGAETVLPEPIGSQHLAAKRKILRELTRVIADGIDEGAFRPVDPRTAALSVLGMCNWVAWWFKPGSDIDPVVASVADLAIGMLTTNGKKAARTQATRTVAQIRALLDQLDPPH